MTIDGIWNRNKRYGARPCYQDWTLCLSDGSQITSNLDWDDEAVDSQRFRGVTLALMSGTERIESETAESASEYLDDSQGSDESFNETEDAMSICASNYSSPSTSSNTGSSNVASEMFHGLILYPLADGSFVRIGIFEMDVSALEHFSEDYKNFDIV